MAKKLMESYNVSNPSKHHKGYNVSEKDLKNILDEAVEAFKEPNADHKNIALALVTKLTISANNTSHVHYDTAFDDIPWANENYRKFKALFDAYPIKDVK